jgi:hypothetical protein
MNEKIQQALDAVIEAKRKVIKAEQLERLGQAMLDAKQVSFEEWEEVNDALHIANHFAENCVQRLENVIEQCVREAQ